MTLPTRNEFVDGEAGFNAVSPVESQGGDAGTDHELTMARERGRLMREVQDIISNCLSTASMQLMLSDESGAPELLSRVREVVRTMLRRANSGARLLADLMEQDATMCTTSQDVRTLGAEVPLSTATADFEDALREQGLHGIFVVPDAVDDLLDTTTQRTLVRVLRNSLPGILRHAPPGGTCTVTVSIHDDAVSLQIRYPFETTTSRSSDDDSLLALRCRVSLTGGVLVMGESGGKWALTVTLPLEY